MTHPIDGLMKLMLAGEIESLMESNPGMTEEDALNHIKSEMRERSSQEMPDELRDTMGRLHQAMDSFTDAINAIAGCEGVQVDGGVVVDGSNNRVHGIKMDIKMVYSSSDETQSTSTGNLADVLQFPGRETQH